MKVLGMQLFAAFADTQVGPGVQAPHTGMSIHLAHSACTDRLFVPQTGLSYAPQLDALVPMLCASAGGRPSASARAQQPSLACVNALRAAVRMRCAPAPCLCLPAALRP